MAYDFSKLETQIKETEEWLSRELIGIRTGRATPTLLDSVKPEAYGTHTPLTQLAGILVEDPRSLRIIPWDMSLVKVIEKGIVDADLGVGVSTDDTGLHVSFPELTAERRTQLGKIARDKVERARVTLRSHRTDALKELDAVEKEGGIGKDEMKRLKEEIQKRIDSGTGAITLLLEKKEREITQ